MEADTAKNLGALEAQLLALSNTKNDMRTLRTHIAGLEEALEELNTANDGLRRELGRKSELIERHSKRIQRPARPESSDRNSPRRAPRPRWSASVPRPRSSSSRPLAGRTSCCT